MCRSRQECASFKAGVCIILGRSVRHFRQEFMLLAERCYCRQKCVLVLKYVCIVVLIIIGWTVLMYAGLCVVLGRSVCFRPECELFLAGMYIFWQECVLSARVCVVG